MVQPAARICSLLPSATEIVYALGLQDRLVAVTHECDFPPDAASKPAVTSNVIDGENLTAAEIDQAVRASLAENATIYHLDLELLESLRPDLFLTQDLCDVCAVGSNEVRELASSLSYPVEVVSLDPHCLTEVLDSILHVGRLTGELRRAIEVVAGLKARLERVSKAVRDRSRRRVLCLEWLDPPFTAGHWVPDMVEIAGGDEVLGRTGEYSRECTWDEVETSEPDVIITMPCGFGLERSRRELDATPLPAAWNDLPAVRRGDVFVVDGSSYFNRPGPRIVEGVEILASILHPQAGVVAPPASFARYENRRSTPVA